MTFTGLLPPLLFSLLFLLPAWYFWRLGRRGVAAIPAVIALALFVFTLAVYLQDARGVQARHDLDGLLNGLADPTTLEITDLGDPEELLFLAGAASQGLYRQLGRFPERDDEIRIALGRLAGWVTERDNFRQWRRSADWDREMFFLARAGSVLGHYQLATGDETYADQFRRIGDYLSRRLRRARYKHLISREEEDYLRPADNAAALYVLTLYDRTFGEDVAGPTYREWADYLRDELYYAESRLPCAAFSTTNRCRLEPSATATGLYICYRAAAAPIPAAEDDIPYVEWLHYFKRSSLTPFSLSVRSNMRRGQEARFCTLGARPLACGRYEAAIGLWAAAEYGGGYTYFRLFSGPVLRRWLGRSGAELRARPAVRARALTTLALRLIAQGHRG